MCLIGARLGQELVRVGESFRWGLGSIGPEACEKRRDNETLRAEDFKPAYQDASCRHRAACASDEVRFRGWKGDQLRKGAVVTHVRKGPSMRVGEGGGAVDLMIELMSCYLFLPSSAPCPLGCVCRW